MQIAISSSIPSKGTAEFSLRPMERAVTQHSRQNPSPTNGATEVPVVTDLTWTDAEYICEAYLCGGDDSVFLGTTATPPLLGSNFDHRASVVP
jgi:hypothetical protein